MQSKLENLKRKIVSLEEAKSLVESWKSQGLKVVFTNGCFDILHQGHVVYLNKAADMGDRLVVALNTDASVKKQNKGEERPINPEDARLLVLAGLACVDAVLLFEEETPLSLIETLLPDVLVKGADYDPNEVDASKKTYIVGSDVVRKQGGETRVVDLEAGFSTTAIVRKLKS